ncbi:MAG: outer membrane protein assembly factor BamE [Gammaproteobacteria bacterium]|nr:outer membrane protein assembly factor BamE [Gammaproteobacteria bacterium]
MGKILRNLVIVSAFLPACTIHTIDIQQGNVIEADAVAQLQTGMTQDRVRFIMGTPLLQDPFHANRWDYIYTKQDGAAPYSREHSRVTVFFEDGKVTKIDKQ